MSLLCWRVRLPVDLMTRVTDEKAKSKFQGTSGKCRFRFRINTVLRGVASNCYLLISLVMVVVAKSWAYGELPRSSRRWHFPKLSGLFCGKEIQGRHPQVSTGWFLHWMDYPPYLERDESFFSLSPGGSILALVQLLAQGFKSDHLLWRERHI